MTRIEAANFLSNLSVFQYKESDYKKALDMAIEALKNQPKFIIHSDGRVEQIQEEKEDMLRVIEDIKAEIKQVACEESADVCWSAGLRYSLKIIDKHIRYEG